MCKSKKIKVLKFNSVNDVANFVSKLADCPYQVDILNGKYAYDAKSFLNIVSNSTGIGELAVQYPDFNDGLEEIINKYEKHN